MVLVGASCTDTGQVIADGKHQQRIRQTPYFPAPVKSSSAQALNRLPRPAHTRLPAATLVAPAPWQFQSRDLRVSHADGTCAEYSTCTRTEHPVLAVHTFVKERLSCMTPLSALQLSLHSQTPLQRCLVRQRGMYAHPRARCPRPGFRRAW